MRKVCLWLLAVCLAVSGSLPAQTRSEGKARRTHGRLQFQPPPGWQAFERADLLVFVPAGSTLQNTSASITLFPPAARRAQPLAQWMKALLGPVRSGYRVLKTEDPAAIASARGLSILAMTELLRDQTGPGLIYQLYCAVEAGGTGQLIIYSAANPHEFERGAHTVNALLESLSVLKITPGDDRLPPASKTTGAPAGKVSI